jgi:tRNA splicing endonuclease
MKMETIIAKEFLENTLDLSMFTYSEVETLITALQLFAKGKCKEQRQLCHDEIVDEEDEVFQEHVDAVRTLILNANEPEF